MGFSSYTTKFPKKGKLFLLFISLLLIFTQVYYMFKKQVSIPSTTQSQNDISGMIIDDDDPVNTVPPPKQSMLTGFAGFKSQLPKIQHEFSPEPEAYTILRESRRNAIKKSFLHGWTGYKTYAMGHDELRPLSNTTKDSLGGWGATMIDSLSTLAIMELTDEFQKVLPRINRINLKVDKDINVFETVIRYLGGMLSAYELTDRKHDMLITKSTKIAVELLEAFNTPSGFPHPIWNIVRNSSVHQETLIAEVATVQLELMMMSQHTGDVVYGQKAQEITDFLDSMRYEHGLYIQGLYPTTLDTHQGRFKNAVSTFGGMGDSAFEYFLKEYLLMDGSEPQYGRMYTQSIKSMKRYMLRQVPEYDLLLLPPYDTQHMTHKNTMDHLTCFVPGMLAMGSITFDEPEDMEIAKGLLETCVYMYRTTETGLSPESWSLSKTIPYNPVTFNKTKSDLERLRNWWYDDETINPLIQKKMEEQLKIEEEEEEYEPVYVKKEEIVLTNYSNYFELPPVRKRPESLVLDDKRYLLRPETVESLFIMYRITGDQKYQEYGWEIYESIEKWSKTKSGYASIRNVDQTPKDEEEDMSSNQIDSMETFLFAETFKYLYLLFSPPDVISLDKFIFNTGGHPFTRRSWNWESILKKYSP